MANGDATSAEPVQIQSYQSAADLQKAIHPDVLKSELARLGLKCGGTVADRAKRLFLTKDTPLDQLAEKHFSKSKKVCPSPDQSRVSIARLEALVVGLLDQLSPTLEHTTRQAERRLTQTTKERTREVEEEVYGAPTKLPDDASENSDTESEDEAPIYNPKGVPLGWDGKPIPYWLFKLHGLNHFFPCEICGNESYRGRRNFEKHFTESKHAYGMRCLEIPNTKHFHGVTKIADAKMLWERLREGVEDTKFDGEREEEYEDSHGNVLSRATYEDLARQGLL